MLALDRNAGGEGYKPNLDNIIICPDCQEVPPNLTEEFSSGDMVCTSCGVVVGEKIIDTRSEWRTFANSDSDQGNEDPSRVGDQDNPLLNGSQLKTSIAAGESRAQKALARLQNNAHQDKATRALLEAYKEIGQLCESINTGKTVSEGAKHIYKLVDDHKVLKGKPQEAVIAGCIFVACRQAKVPRTFHEIFSLTKVSKKEIGRVFKALESFLQKLQASSTAVGTINSVDAYENSASTGAEALCARFCSQLTFRNAQKIENLSRDLARNTSLISELSGRSPLSVASACIYMACNLLGEPRPSKDIAMIAGVSDGTVKTAYRFLYHARDKMIPEDWRKEDMLEMSRLPTS